MHSELEISFKLPDISELQEQDRGEADRRLLPPRSGGEDQETRHQVSAWLQCTERSGKPNTRTFI